MRTLVLILSLLFCFSCRSKVATKSKEVIKENLHAELQVDAVQSTAKEAVKDSVVDWSKFDQKQTQTEATEIFADVTTDQPFLFTETKNGLVTRWIEVTGNAKVNIKTNTDSSSQTNTSTLNSKVSEKRKDNVQSNKKVSQKQDSTVERVSNERRIKTNGFSWGVYLIWFFIAVGILLILYLSFITDFGWLKNIWSKILNRKR